MEVNSIESDKLEDNFFIDFRYTFLQILDKCQRTLIKLKLLNLKLLALKQPYFLLSSILLSHEYQFLHISPKLRKNRNKLINKLQLRFRIEVGDETPNICFAVFE